MTATSALLLSVSQTGSSFSNEPSVKSTQSCLSLMDTGSNRLLVTSLSRASQSNFSSSELYSGNFGVVKRSGLGGVLGGIADQHGNLYAVAGSTAEYLVSFPTELVTALVRVAA